MKIFFNKPFTAGTETRYIGEAIHSGSTAGNGPFNRRCANLLENEFRLGKSLLTSSCTDALEMCALLAEIKPGDEVIVPAFTFVSTALAFKRQGATIIFADSREDNPCIDENKIEALITPRTRVIVPVHYAGIACNMKLILEIGRRHNLLVVEDAAHAFGSAFNGKPLGTYGQLGCFSFHETKILHCGEGGMLSINDDRFIDRAEKLWEKGTNRCDFHKGLAGKYEWVDTGSSFLLSDVSAAFLYAQLLKSKEIIARRKFQWELYFNALSGVEEKGFLKLPSIVPSMEPNYSVFYILTRDLEERTRLLGWLEHRQIQALTHYLDLGQSPFILKHQPPAQVNVNSARYQDTLLRLPLFHDLEADEIQFIADSISEFYYNEQHIR